METTEKLIKIFFDWTKLKIRIHASDVKKFPKEKSIWWASLGQNIGVEINGKNKNFERPVLIIKKYSKDSLLILPISSKEKEGIYYFKFIDNEGRKNIVNLSQLKTISSKRVIREMGKIDNIDFQQIKERLKNLI